MFELLAVITAIPCLPLVFLGLISPLFLPSVVLVLHPASVASMALPFWSRQFLLGSALLLVGMCFLCFGVAWVLSASLVVDLLLPFFGVGSMLPVFDVVLMLRAVGAGLVLSTFGAMLECRGFRMGFEFGVVVGGLVLLVPSVLRLNLVVVFPGLESMVGGGHGSWWSSFFPCL